MSGKKQHEIPKLYQRGFLIADTDNVEQVFAFRRGRGCFRSSIGGSGAERFFYSKLSTDGGRTLDDEITAYESRLGVLVGQLRSSPPGAFVDGEVAAEVITHLTKRNAHIRGAFAHGLKTIASGALKAFGDEKGVRRLLGIDGPMVSDKFRANVAETLSGEPRVAALEIPRALLEQFAFVAMREGFSVFFEQLQPILEAVLSNLAEEAPRLAREGHQKGLAKVMGSDRRIEMFSGFRWNIVATENDLILPDCVALAVERGGQFHPFMMASADDIEVVLLPLTSRSLLVGAREGARSFDPMNFNMAAASCSHIYFLSASCTDEFISLMDTIGTASVSVVNYAVNEGLQPFLSTENAESLESPRDTGDIPISFPIVPVACIGNFDHEGARKITDALSRLVSEVILTIPLDRLDGITVADDYPAALLAVDRGISGIAPLTTRQDERAFGVAQCPNVIRDGVIKSHIVVRGNVGRMLLSEDRGERKLAAAVVANQLGHAGFIQMLDEALPGALMTPVDDVLDKLLGPCSLPGWSAYFASRATATFDERWLYYNQEILLIAIEEGFVEIPRARLAYREHGNMNELLRTVLPRISFLLEHAGSLLGHADGTGREPLEGAEALEIELRNRDLYAWLADYHRDLTYLWDRRGRWTSYKEFLALNRHAGRLLWPFSIIPWTTPSNECRIEVPIHIDAETLKSK